MNRDGAARILLTSAGSGVAACVLDSLAGRRDHVILFGSDLQPDTPGLARCDEVVALPAVTDPDYVAAVARVCADARIDLVIPGTDHDVAALAAAAADPDSAVRMPSAPAELVAMTRDKWRTAQWCQAAGVPFAATEPTGAEHSTAGIAALVEAHGFPLICKPRDGSASAGVTVVRNGDQLATAVALPGMILQPFLDPPPAAAFDLNTSAGIPLFWEVPCPDEPAIMIVIGPDGEVGPHLCFTATHRLGRNEDLRAFPDASLDEFARKCAVTFGGLGWRGPLNLQVRRGRAATDGSETADAQWQLIEINPRFTGGTSGRLHLGLDEVRWIVNRWIGRDVIPPHPHAPVTEVRRRLVDIPVTRSSR